MRRVYQPITHREARAWEVFLAIVEHRQGAGALQGEFSRVGTEAALCAFKYADAFAAVASAPPEVEEGES